MNEKKIGRKEARKILGLDKFIQREAEARYGDDMNACVSISGPTYVLGMKLMAAHLSKILEWAANEGYRYAGGKWARRLSINDTLYTTSELVDVYFQKHKQ